MLFGLKGGAMAYVVDDGPEERTGYVIAQLGRVVAMIDALGETPSSQAAVTARSHWVKRARQCTGP